MREGRGWKGRGNRERTACCINTGGSFFFYQFVLSFFFSIAFFVPLVSFDPPLDSHGESEKQTQSRYEDGDGRRRASEGWVARTLTRKAGGGGQNHGGVDTIERSWDDHDGVHAAGAVHSFATCTGYSMIKQYA